ncbi:hypothetical protein YC2023_091523 [Brassica napus]
MVFAHNALSINSSFKTLYLHQRLSQSQATLCFSLYHHQPLLLRPPYSLFLSTWALLTPSLLFHSQSLTLDLPSLLYQPLSSSHHFCFRTVLASHYYNIHPRFDCPHLPALLFCHFHHSTI